eukprot:COSAG01_NODE_984_length_12344_cov_215.085362_14_plen_227_part_00
MSRHLVSLTALILLQGKKGSTDYWAPGGLRGVRKRYGNILRRREGVHHKYHEFCLLYRNAKKDEAIELKDKCLFEAFSAAWSKSNRGKLASKKLSMSKPSHVFRDTSVPGRNRAIVDVRLQVPQKKKARGDPAAKAKFMSFQVTPGPGGASEIELGAIVRQGSGITLESAQGDFAEWHRRKAGEPPFQEGDVIGFDRRGLISRRTAGAIMLGVISRKVVSDRHHIT